MDKKFSKVSIVSMPSRNEEYSDKSTADPRLNELRYEAIRFAALTTAHGIPMALNATKWYARALWIVLSFFSVGIFAYQCVLVYEKFMRKDKIVNVKVSATMDCISAKLTVSSCNSIMFRFQQ